MLFISSYDFYALLTEIYFLNAICALLIYGVILNTSYRRGHPVIEHNVSGLSTQILIVSLWLTVCSNIPCLTSWNSLLVHDFLSFGIKSTILAISLLWSLIIFSYNRLETINLYEY